MMRVLTALLLLTTPAFAQNYMASELGSVLPLIVLLFGGLFFAFVWFTQRDKKLRAQARSLVTDARTPTPTPASTPTPLALDTEGAIEDMRLAHSYLKDWEERKAGASVLGQAAKYLKLAASKDPNAQLTIEDKSDTYTLTNEDLSGTVLFYEAQEHFTENASPQTLQSVRGILERAIAYKPYSTQYRSLLADVFLNLHDKRSALKVAEDAVSQAPHNLDARKLLDRIQAAPITHPPTIMDTNPGCVWAGIGAAVILVGVIGMFYGSYSMGILFILVGFGFFGIANFAEGKQMLKKAIRHQMDQNERARRK